MGKIKKYKRIFTLLVLDTFLVSCCYYFAFFLRFDGFIPWRYLNSFVHTLPLVIICRIAAFWSFNVYKGILRYASIGDMLNILKGSVVSSFAIIIAVALFWGFKDYPRSVIIIDLLSVCFLVNASRFFSRFCRGKYFGTTKDEGKKVLIIGAGDAGEQILREIRSNPKLDYIVVGFIDDDKFKQGRIIHGVSVIGTTMDIVRICVKNNIAEIIIAIPSATRTEMNLIIEECKKTKVRLNTIPALGDLIDGKVNINQKREVQIEDLLNREVVKVDMDSIHKYIDGKTVLVTGAGGSIGSEICRRIFNNCSVKKLILFGRGEHSIYEIYRKLAENGKTELLVRTVGDVINKRKLKTVFKKYRPEIVFHAGADKHVPLLEHNPDEAILNNIIGTKNLIEVAEEFAAEKVVCISTDKAADPVSVMGCSKRIAEIVIQGRRHSKTKTIAVRFGNVLGSRGSVIPLFREQIKNGGPITVTHPDMLRFFMTIPEAAQLVIQAGAIGQGGEIFLLDMGSPVKIVDLARQMIKLSGFTPDVDILVKFSGLRPGEKLEETLTGRGENIKKTMHPKILIIEPTEEKPDFKEEDFKELINLAIDIDADGIKRKLKEMVPNYSPN